MKVEEYYELKIDARGKKFTSLTSLTITHKGKSEFCVIGGSSIGDIIRVPLTSQPAFEYKSIIKAHSGEVTQIYSDSETMQLCTLGSDNYIRIWKVGFDSQPQGALKASTESVSISLELIKGLTITPQIPLFIRCLFDHDLIALTIVTTHQSIVIVNLSKEDGYIVKLITHRIDEDHTKPLNDIAINAQLQLSASIAKDKLIKIWDLKTNSLVREINIPEEGESIAFANPRGDLLVGCSNDIFLLRMEEYLPNKILRKCLVEVFEDDGETAEVTFNSDIDFWKIFKSDEQKKSEALEKDDADKST